SSLEAFSRLSLETGGRPGQAWPMRSRTASRRLLPVGAASSIAGNGPEIRAAIDFGQRQRGAKRRHPRLIVARSQPPSREPAVTCEDDHLDDILRDDDIVRERRQARVCGELPAEIAILGGR